MFQPAKIALVAFAAASALLLQAPAQAESSWSTIQKKGVLRCGAAPAPVYVMRDPKSGQYSGIHADLCRDFGEQVLNVKVEFVDATWDNLVAGLQSNKWDMALALNPTPERSLVVAFSDPVVSSETAFVMYKNNPKFAAAGNSIIDYDKVGVVIGTQAGSTHAAALKPIIKQATVQLLPAIDEVRLGLMSRRVDIWAGDSIEQLTTLATNPGYQQVPLNPALEKGYVAFGLSREMSAADLATLNIYLRRRKDAGDFERMVEESVQQAVAATQ